jgi:flagellar biogenesis protein FliO
MDPSASSLAGPSIWQVAAALLVVLGLLILAMKLLRRFGFGARGTDGARLLATRRLGPKRELEVLAVDDAVYTLYRHDGGLVVLKSEPREVYELRQPTPAPTAAAGAEALGRRLRALAAAAGGAARRETAP